MPNPWLAFRVGLAASACAIAGACSSARIEALGEPFRDCADCPAMMMVPAGEFVMGAPGDEEGRFEEEGPTHRVRIAGFAVGLTPVTRHEYGIFVRATGRGHAPGCNAMSDAGEWTTERGLTWRSPGFEQADDHPVVCVSWDDAQAYVRWLSERAGRSYRLLSESEFEYAARAGTTTTFPWGVRTGEACDYANGFDASAKRLHPDWPAFACDDGYAHTSPVEAFPANAFGLRVMTGNVYQWVQDCFEDSYAGAPADGAAWARPPCKARVIRGGSWLNGARGLRAAMRDRDPQAGRYTNIGIRVARSL